MRDENFGGLLTHLTGGSDRAGGGDGPLVVLMHGFGAPGTDLVGLERMLRVPGGTRFAFPEAPLSLPEFPFPARAWWRIDLARFEQARTQADLLARSNEVPEGLVHARERVIACLNELQERLSVPSEKIVLGGFSQGAMIACDVALSDPRPLAGLALLSTTLISAQTWLPRMSRREGLRVFQSHGQVDAILPFVAADKLRELWVEAGAEHEWVEFRGGHEIPPPVLEKLGAFITRSVS